MYRQSFIMVFVLISFSISAHIKIEKHGMNEQYFETEGKQDFNSEIEALKVKISLINGANYGKVFVYDNEMGCYKGGKWGTGKAGWWVKSENKDLGKMTSSELKYLQWVYNGTDANTYDKLQPDGKTRKRSYYGSGFGLRGFYTSTEMITDGLVLDGTWKFSVGGKEYLEMKFENGQYITSTVINEDIAVYKWDNGNIQGTGPSFWRLNHLKKSSDGRWYIPSGEFVFPSGFNRTGHWKHYYESGSIKSEGAYNNMTNKPKGKWISYYETGEKWKETEGRNEKGLYEGGFKIYYKNGNLKSEGTYKNGDWYGQSKTYYSNGPLKYESTWNADGTGKRKHYVYEWNVLSYVEEGPATKAAKKTGIWTRKNTNDKLQATMDYNEGKRTRYIDAYDVNGIQTLTNGNGKLIMYFNGQKSFECEYENGQRSGTAIWHYPSGQLQRIAIYKQDPSTIGSADIGLRWEIVKMFSDDGVRLDPGTLKNGNGSWNDYDKSGKLTGVTTYANGKKVSYQKR